MAGLGRCSDTRPRQSGSGLCGFRDTSAACRCPGGENTQHLCVHTHTVHTHANTHTCAHTRTHIHGHAHSTARLGSTILTHKHSSLWLFRPPAAQETKHKCVTQNLRRRPCSTSPICEETLGSSGPVSDGAQSMSDSLIVHCRAFKPTPKGLLPYRPQEAA